MREGRVETPLGLLGDASDLPDGLAAVAYVRPNAISIIEDGAAKEGLPAKYRAAFFSARSSSLA